MSLRLPFDMISRPSVSKPRGFFNSKECVNYSGRGSSIPIVMAPEGDTDCLKQALGACRRESEPIFQQKNTAYCFKQSVSPYWPLS